MDISFNKTSGTGPGEFVITCGPNTTADVLTQTVRVTCNGETKTVNLTQEAGPVVVIPEFDYLVLRYSWGDDDGSDFDTATGFTNTGISGVDGLFVGWSRGYTTTQEQVGEYLIHGGDNMASGAEACLIQMGVLMEDPGLDDSEDTIELVIYGNWYGSRGTGNVTVSFTAYLGGTMTKSGFNFTNNGGEEVYTGSVTTNVAATGHDNYQNITSLYSRIGTMQYNKESRDCVITLGA